MLKSLKVYYNGRYEYASLSECHFCSSETFKIVNNYGEYYVECRHCGARGPKSKSMKQACLNWNRPYVDY